MPSVDPWDEEPGPPDEPPTDLEQTLLETDGTALRASADEPGFDQRLAACDEALQEALRGIGRLMGDRQIQAQELIRGELASLGRVVESTRQALRTGKNSDGFAVSPAMAGKQLKQAFDNVRRYGTSFRLAQKYSEEIRSRLLAVRDAIDGATALLLGEVTAEAPPPADLADIGGDTLNLRRLGVSDSTAAERTVAGYRRRNLDAPEPEMPPAPGEAPRRPVLKHVRRTAGRNATRAPIPWHYKVAAVVMVSLIVLTIVAYTLWRRLDWGAGNRPVADREAVRDDAGEQNDESAEGKAVVPAPAPTAATTESVSTLPLPPAYHEEENPSLRRIVLMRFLADRYLPADALATADEHARASTRIRDAFLELEKLPWPPPRTAIAPETVGAQARQTVDREMSAYPPFAQAEAERLADERYRPWQVGEQVTVTYMANPVRAKTLTGEYRGYQGGLVFVGSQQIPYDSIVVEFPWERQRFDPATCLRERGRFLNELRAEYEAKLRASREALMKQRLGELAATATATNHANGYTLYNGTWVDAEALLRHIFAERR